MARNTKFCYTYRDGSNYKQFEEIVLPGEITEQQKDLILSKRDEGQYFIPSQVDLSDLQSKMIGFPSGDDHVWHELDTDDIFLTEETPTDWAVEKFGDISGLVRKFGELEGWNVTQAAKELGIE